MHKQMRYSIKTFGCKVNQFDSVRLAETLEGFGLTRAGKGEAADVCVINTCTVTARSDTQCRQMIRRMVRENPGAYVVVTGCYAETSPELLRAIEGVDRVMGNREKVKAREILIGDLEKEKNRERNGIPEADNPAGQSLDCGNPRTPPVHGAGDRSRAFLTVQDGCDAFCAYCIVPYARGGPKSVDPDQVCRQVRYLVERGFPEIVLSGIHLGAYGVDFHEKQGLSRLLRRLIRIPGGFRIRISSVEPIEVGEDLVDLVIGEEKICDHFHIPLQSGENRILRRMGRPYTREDYADLVFSIRERSPVAAIGTDLIAGFPGETKDSFEEALEWISGLPLTHFHIFPYSERPGTRAASMDGQVKPSERKERAARLRKICADKKRRFLREMTGRILEGVQISQKPSLGEGVKVLTGNYLEGHLRDPEETASGIFPVRVLRVRDETLLLTASEEASLG